jgi:hypothetical protein
MFWRHRWILFFMTTKCVAGRTLLEDGVEAADPKFLKEIAGKDAREASSRRWAPDHDHREYLAPDQVSAGHLIGMIQNQRAPLVEWNSHFYVVAGVTYVETIDSVAG